MKIGGNQIIITYYPKRNFERGKTIVAGASEGVRKTGEVITSKKTYDSVRKAFNEKPPKGAAKRRLFF